MASKAITKEEENYVRMALLLTGVSPRAVRAQFDTEFDPASLSSTLCNNPNKTTLNNLKSNRVINQTQWNLLFPSSGKFLFIYRTK